MITLQLFSTTGCHLCELAIDQINSFPADMNVQLQIVEIGDDDHLVEQYGIRIPVIKFSDGSELNWPFTYQDILQKITSEALEL